jgi:hypothetical protein
MATATLDISIGAGLTREQAEAIFAQGQEAVVFALLELAKRLAESQGKRNPSTTLSTPSGMVPVYEKPAAKGRGKKRPGAKKGHPGSRRESRRIDRQAEHQADNCSERGRPPETLCGNPHPLHRRHSRRPTGSHRAHDSSRLVPALPKEGRTAGGRRPAWRHAGQPVLVLSAWLHYALCKRSRRSWKSSTFTCK